MGLFEFEHKGKISKWALRFSKLFKKETFEICSFLLDLSKGGKMLPNPLTRPGFDPSNLTCEIYGLVTS